ncbi:MAG TPA: hypothetical protein PLL75_07660 [Candidatus Omnitrophota bacterium]|nr:hypothetical protein [Candidatus Omnitrophota bacterium]HPS37583.1 hypothetical protein [Candidatus Omnitrophota bacterium]
MKIWGEKAGRAVDSPEFWEYSIFIARLTGLDSPAEVRGHKDPHSVTNLFFFIRGRFFSNGVPTASETGSPKWVLDGKVVKG